MKTIVEKNLMNYTKDLTHMKREEMRKRGWNYPFLVQGTKGWTKCRKKAGAGHLWGQVRLSPGITARLAQVATLSLLSCLGFNEKTKIQLFREIF